MVLYLKYAAIAINAWPTLSIAQSKHVAQDEPARHIELSAIASRTKAIPHV